MNDMKNTINCMKSFNKYRIYECGEKQIYFFVLNDKEEAIYGIGEEIFVRYNKLLLLFEQEAYRYFFNEGICVRSYPSMENPDWMYRGIRKSGRRLISDENGRYFDRMGEFAKKCYSVDPYYFCFYKKEDRKMSGSYLYDEYVVVMATDSYTADDWFNLCYPSMLKYSLSCDKKYAIDNWDAEKYADKEPYEVITEESILKEFGKGCAVRTGINKLKFGQRMAKPRQMKPYMTKDEVAFYQRFDDMLENRYRTKTVITFGSKR